MMNKKLAFPLFAVMLMTVCACGQQSAQNTLDKKAANAEYVKDLVEKIKHSPLTWRITPNDSLGKVRTKSSNGTLVISASDNLIQFDASHLVIKNPYYSDATNNYPKSYSVILNDNLIALFENGKFCCINLNSYERNRELENKLNTRIFDYQWIINNQLCGLSEGGLFVWNGNEWTVSKEPFPLTDKPKCYDDTEFVVYGDCEGEWGGTVYFYEKATGKTYFTESTCTNTVSKTKDGYEVLADLGHMMGSSEMKVIPDPRKLTLAKPEQIGKLVNHEALGYTDQSKAYKTLFDLSGIQIISTFTYENRKLYVLYNNYSLFLAEITNKSIEIVSPIFTKYIYLNYPLTSTYGDYTMINLGHYQTASDREVSVLIFNKHRMIKIDWNNNQFH